MATPHHQFPLIGCTTYRKMADQNPPIEVIGLMSSYIDAIIAAGGVPVLIPLGLSDEQLLAAFARIDGLLLPGGGDIDPVEYHGRHHETLGGVDVERDRAELLMARAAVARQKPVLAICRGIQVLNVALGGDLYEDIFTMMPNALRHDNVNQKPRNHLAHEVSVRPGSLLARQLGKMETAVNSLHHQGINRLAAELAASATAPDGLIEAVEVPGHPYALGVQWHPENLIHDNPEMLALFKGLVSAAGSHSAA